MRKILPGVAMALCVAGAAHATTVSDPPNDPLPSFTAAGFTFFDDLDITSFTVTLNSAQTLFDFSATLKGPFDPTHTGIYVIGVDTGAGAIGGGHPFADIGEPNVVFDQAIVVFNNKTAVLGGNPLTGTYTNDSFDLVIPVSKFPSTGFGSPRDYRFNLWARNGLSANNQNADFAPENATFTAVPEPAGWALMIGGLGLMGATVRRRRAAAAV